MTERQIPNMISYLDWLRQCGHPENCQMYFKKEKFVENGRVRERMAKGSFCQCEAPKEKDT